MATLLEAISWFQENAPENTLVFAFFDAEEMGIAGSAAFVHDLPEQIEDLKQRYIDQLLLIFDVREDTRTIHPRNSI